MDLLKVDVGSEIFENPDEWSVKYNYHYGRMSPFFRAMKEDAKILGTKCPECGRICCPPRIDCPTCFVKADWVELPLEGTIDTFCITHFKVAGVEIDVPYCLANVNIDGTDTTILQKVSDVDFNKIEIGMKVKARFKETREGKITDFEFVPIEVSN